MLHFQMCNSVLNDCAAVNVGWADNVGDVAVDEDISWLEAENGGLWNARIGAAEPKNGWGLAGGELRKERWVLMRFVRCPSVVGRQGVGERILYLRR